MTERDPFPLIIDNSALSAFKKCPLDWYYSTIRKIAPIGGNIHLHFGGSYAAGLEAGRNAFYRDGKTEEEAVLSALEAATRFWGAFEEPEGTAKSYDRLIHAICEYFEQYPMGSDIVKPHVLANGKLGVEFTFAVPFPGVLHPTTGEPILYAGRFDMLAEREEVLFVEDDKTASQLGPQWSKNWLLDSQFTGYVWAAKHYDLPVAGAIIRGLSILKTGYGHSQAIVYRPQWQIDRWIKTTQHTMRMMIAYWQEGFYPPVLDKHSCNSYGGCGFSQLCESPNPEGWIKLNYEPRIWDPTAKYA
jgi:hypothetical protein